MSQSDPQVAAEAEEALEPLGPATLMEAILAAQGELPKLTKDETATVKSRRTGGTYTYRYIGLDGVMEAVLPVLNKNGLVWVTMPVHRPEGPSLRYRLIFAEDGEEIEGEMLLPVEATVEAQALGSAITYCRRYALIAVLGLAPDEDDEGKKAAEGQKAAQQRQADLRNAQRPMSDEEVERMTEAVRVAGGDLPALLAEAGVGEDETPTIGQGRRVKQLLAEAS